MTCHLTIDYLNKYSNQNNIFLETGTFEGEAVKIAKEFGFKHIHSIELDRKLFEKNVKDFEKDENIIIWHGDSVDIIPQILRLHPDQTITFWLDAHASGPLAGGRYGSCPLLKELECIVKKKVILSPQGLTETQDENIQHTIFIDDCRLMGTSEWGYVSKQSILNFLQRMNKDYKFEMLDGHIKNDVLVAYI